MNLIKKISALFFLAALYLSRVAQLALILMMFFQGRYPYQNMNTALKLHPIMIGSTHNTDSSLCGTLSNSVAGMPGIDSGKPQLVVPFGHQQGIANYFFNVGKNLLITSDPGESIIWDTRSGKPLHYFYGHDPQFSPDEKLIATIDNKNVLLWDVRTGNLLQKLSHLYPVMKVRYHPTHPQLITVLNTNGQYEINHSSIVVCWDYLHGKKLHQFSQDITRQEMLDNKCSTCYNNIDCPLYDAVYDETGSFILTIYNAAIKSYRADNFAHDKSYCLAGQYDPEASIISLPGHIVERISPEQHLIIYCDETGKLLAKLPYSAPPPTLLSSIGKEIVTVSLDRKHIALCETGKLRIVNLNANEVKFFDVTASKVYFNRTSTKLLVQMEGRLFALIDLISNQLSMSPVLTDNEGWPDYLFVPKISRHTSLITSRFNADTIMNKIREAIPDSIMNKMPFDFSSIMSDNLKLMGKGAQNFYLREGEVLNTLTGRTISRIEASTIPISEIQSSMDGKIISFSNNSTKCFYSIPDASLLSSIDREFATKTYLMPDNQSCLFLQNQEHPKHYIYNYFTRQLTLLKDLNNEPVTDVVFSKNGRYCTLIAHEKKIVWDFKENKFISTPYVKTGVKEISINDEKGVVTWNENEISYLPLSNTPTVKRYEIEDLRKEKFEHVIVSPKEDFLYVQYSDNKAQLHSIKNKKVNFEMMLSRQPEKNPIENIGTLVQKLETEGWTQGFAQNKKKLHADFNREGSELMVWSEDTAFVINCFDGKLKRKFSIKGEVAVMNTGNDILICSSKGQIVVYRISTGQEWFTMVPFSDNNTAFVLPDGSYYGSREVTHRLGYVTGLQSISYRQFDLVNNRPDKVLRVLGNKNDSLMSLLRDLCEKREERAYLKSFVSATAVSTPEVFILNEKEIPAEIGNKVLPLLIRLSDSKTALAYCRVSVNGVLLYGEDIPITRKRTLSFDTALSINLSEGKNIIEVSAINAGLAESFKNTLYITYTPVRKVERNIYFVGLGVDHYKKQPDKDLDWCVKDISDLTICLQKLYGKHLIVNTLLNEDVNERNLDIVREKLTKANEDDIIIFCYSGHGKIDTKKRESYFGTTDWDFNNPGIRGLSFASFENLVAHSRSRNRLLLIDACHSGEFDPLAYGSMKNKATHTTAADTDLFDKMLAYFADVAPGDGSFIIAAARGLEDAYTNSLISNSNMVYCVTEGLNKRLADIDHNNEISVGELKNYILNAVPSLQPDQHPVARSENDINDWKLIRNENAVSSGGKPAPLYTKAENRMSSSIKPVTNLPLTTVAPVARNSKTNKPVADSVVHTFKGPLTSLILTEDVTIGFNLKNGMANFVFTCPDYFPTVMVDINQNEKIDSYYDKVFGMTPDNKICVQYMLGNWRFSSCGGSEQMGGLIHSKSYVSVSGQQKIFSIPVTELKSPDSNQLNVRFSFYSYTKKALYYPVERESADRFNQVYQLKISK